MTKLTLLKERDKDLMRAYRMILKMGRFDTQIEAMRAAALSPSKRFWITPERLYQYFSLLKNKQSKYINHGITTRLMYKELVDIVKKLQDRYPDMSLYDICCKAVMQPASQFFISGNHANHLYYLIKKNKRNSMK